MKLEWAKKKPALGATKRALLANNLEVIALHEMYQIDFYRASVEAK